MYRLFIQIETELSPRVSSCIPVALECRRLGRHGRAENCRKKSLMAKFSLLLLAAVTLGPTAGALQAFPGRSYESRQLRKQHKVQRKDLKQQQGAMRKAMGQHELSGEQRGGFKSNLKMQQRLLHKSQKDDSRRLKLSQKAAKAASHHHSEQVSHPRD